MQSKKTSISLIYGFKPKKEVSAIQKYAINLKKGLSDTYNTKLIDCEYPDNGLGQELVNYFVYPKIIKKNKADINHITSQEYAYLGNMLKLKNLIITVHDIFPLTVEKDRTRINYRLRIKLGLKALKKAKMILCDSQYTANELKKYIKIEKNKIKVIQLGYDKDLYKPTDYNDLFKKYKIPAQKKYILYVGSETKRKNFSTLLKAFKIIKEKNPNTLLIKVGGSQDEKARKENTEYIKNNNLNKNVLFTGFVEEKDLPKFYSLAHVFVFPSLAEGFGLPVIEAMACGCPVICSDKGSLLEVGGNAAVYIDPLDTKDIIKKIETLLKNEEFRKKISEKGVKQAKLFGWDICAGKVKKIYDRLILSEKNSKTR